MMSVKWDPAGKPAPPSGRRNDEGERSSWSKIKTHKIFLCGVDTNKALNELHYTKARTFLTWWIIISIKILNTYLLNFNYQFIVDNDINRILTKTVCKHFFGLFFLFLFIALFILASWLNSRWADWDWAKDEMNVNEGEQSTKMHQIYKIQMNPDDSDSHICDLTKISFCTVIQIKMEVL